MARAPNQNRMGLGFRVSGSSFRVLWGGLIVLGLQRCETHRPRHLEHRAVLAGVDGRPDFILGEMANPKPLSR